MHPVVKQPKKFGWGKQRTIRQTAAPQRDQIDLRQATRSPGTRQGLAHPASPFAMSRRGAPHAAAVLTAAADAAIAVNTFVICLDPERESNQHFIRWEGVPAAALGCSPVHVRSVASRFCYTVMKPAFRWEHVISGCVEAHVPGADKQRAYLGHSNSAKDSGPVACRDMSTFREAPDT
jgi:hypothetical protein